jgi:integrase
VAVACGRQQASWLLHPLLHRRDSLRITDVDEGRAGAGDLPAVRGGSLLNPLSESPGTETRGGSDGQVRRVFTTRTGQPVEPRNLVRSFERLIDGAGLRKIRLHDLRHTVATLLKTLGVPQRDAMQILGHARISVTLEIYTDSDSDSQRDALTGMSDRLFGQAGA